MYETAVRLYQVLTETFNPSGSLAMFLDRYTMF